MIMIMAKIRKKALTKSIALKLMSTKKATQNEWLKML